MEDGAMIAAPQDRENDSQGANRWSGSPSTLAALAVALLLGLVFVLSSHALHKLTAPAPNIWLPEAADLIGSVDTRPQRWGFLITAILFGLILAGTVLARPAMPKRLGQWVEDLSARVDRLACLPALAAIFRRKEPAWAGRPLLLSCLVIAFAVFAWAQSRTSFYAGNALDLIKVGDPHIYAVFGKQGEILAGRFDQAASDGAAYGVGMAALYALGRFFGATGGYAYADELARWSNLLVVLVLLWGLFGRPAPRLSVVPALVIAVVAITLALPLLLPNGSGVFAPNLAGIRYIPLALFIAAAGLSPRGSTWISIAGLGICAALGFVYSMDVGLFSLVAYLAFVGLEDGTLRDKFLRVLVFAAVTALATLVLDVVVRKLTSLDILTTLTTVASAESGGYGGLLVHFTLLHSVLAILFVATAFALVLESTSRALDLEERFVGAISILGFVWYYYYLHRPSNFYWIYIYLALFNIRYILRRTSDWATAGQRLGAALAVVAALVMLQQNFKDIGRGFRLEHQTAYRAGGGAGTALSGLEVAPTFGDTMNARIVTLDQNLTPDSIVVTAFPYLVSTASHSTLPPRDIIFSLPTPPDIDSFVRDVLARRPSRLFLEPADTQAWGPEVARTVVSRIEGAISTQYSRDESIGGWRVWNLTPKK